MALEIKYSKIQCSFLKGSDMAQEMPRQMDNKRLFLKKKDRYI